jgi:hypothetical protein
VPRTDPARSPNGGRRYARPRYPTTSAALPGSRLLARALDPFTRPAITGSGPEEAVHDELADGVLSIARLHRTGPRRLAAVLLIDGGASMTVWRSTAIELRRLLERHGAFRAVRTFTVAAAPGTDSPHIRDHGGRPHSAAELLDPTNRQVFLLFTDGIGPLWTDPRVDRLLRLWGRSGPMAILNPFPQGHWHRSYLLPRRGQLRVPRAVAPNAAYQVRYPEHQRNPFHSPADPRSLPIPVLELEARWLSWWVRLVIGGRRWVDGLVHAVDPSAPLPRRDGPTRHESAADRVLRFRSGASPTAFRLATFVAAAPLELPLLRRVQQELLPDSAPYHLAEVVTSDLFQHTGDPAAPLVFADGVREALLACATRDDSASVARTVGLGFTRAIDDPDNAPVSPVTSSTLTHARVEVAVLSALSGPYSRRAQQLRDDIAAVEQGLGRPGDGGMAGQPPREVPDFQAIGTSADQRIPPGVTGIGGHGNGDDMATQRHSDRPPEDQGSMPTGGGDRPTGEGRMTRDEDSVAALDPLEQPGHEARPRIWGDLPTRNPVFTGRQELLEQLDRRLRARNVATVLPQALHGEGGVGKSQIAIEYAYRHRADYDVVWWVPSERPAQVIDSLIKLGKRLLEERPEINVGDDVIIALPRVREALRAGTPYPNWLLIFDNAETLETVRDYFPEAGTGKVLVTSRNRAWGEITETLEVDVFTRPESIALLQRRNVGLTEADADRLAEALGDLPLAIEHGSAWLAATGMGAEEYLALLARKRAELVGLAESPGYEMPVAVAANVALDRLAEENPAAVQLLQICSFFAPEPINRNLFTASRGTQTFAELDEALREPSKFNRAVRDIQRYLLASVDHRANTIQLHRLVQAVLRSRLPAEQRDIVEHGAHVVLAGGRPGDPADPSQGKQYQALAAHLTASRAVACEDDWTRGLVLLLVEFYFYRGDYSTGRALAQDVVDTWRAMAAVGPDHRQTLKAAKWLGYYWWTEGNYRAAVETNTDTLERSRRTLGPDDDGTLDAMNMVAIAQRSLGRFAAARELDQEAYDRARRVYREDDPDTLRAAHNLGVSLRLTGDVRAARELDRDTYRRRVEVLGDDHLETLRTRNSVIIDERECGNYLKAHQMAERLYAHYAGSHGLGHSETIKVARNLAVARRRGGDHEGAFKLAEDTMNRFRERFGPTHPNTIAATLNFAVDIRETGNLPRARLLAIQTAEQYHSALGPDHPYTLYARTNLGIVLRLLGEHQEAHDQNHAAFGTLTALLGPDHILTLTCAVNHASDRFALGDHERAYELDLDTQRRFGDLIGTEHPSTLACTLNLALDMLALGRLEEGESLLGVTLETYRRTLGDNHPAVVAARARARANCDVDPMPL